MLRSSASSTLFPIPSATNFVGEPPALILFSFSASAYEHKIPRTLQGDRHFPPLTVTHKNINNNWIYRVAPQKVSHTVLSISLPNNDRFSNFFSLVHSVKIVVSGYQTYHHTLTASLHNLVKYKMCKIHQYLVKIRTRVWSLIFWPILKVKLCFVLDRLSVFVNIKRQYCHTWWAKNQVPNPRSYIH